MVPAQRSRWRLRTAHTWTPSPPSACSGSVGRPSAGGTGWLAFSSAWRDGIKLVPLLLLPVFLRRGRWRTSLTAVGLVTASYLPHLVAVGVLVLGFLPGYWREEGYDGARRFALLSWLPEHWRMPVALCWRPRARSWPSYARPENRCW